MILDWLVREGWIVLSWWALVTAAGAAAFPLCARLLSGLPDRGYTLARAVGLLLTGYVFWLLGSLGFLRNTSGGILLTWVLVLALGLAVYTRQPLDWRAWWRENRRLVLASEALFIVLLLGWAVVRAHQPELRSTEKPMDLMFVSSIMRSESFPPNDGWMAGYAISYYYFGYLIAAMLSLMSGISSTLGFNMTIALLFALTGLTTFGVVYNLVRARQIHLAESDHLRGTDGIPQRPALLTGLLAMAFVVLMGNLQFPLVEIPFQTRTAGEGYLRFWAVQDRAEYPERAQATAAGIPPDQPVTLVTGSADPLDWEHWWWFRASRILADFNLDGTKSLGAQPINEFPQFSFLLADNHPHVLALPFAVLALGLALNLLLTGRDPNRQEIVFYGLCVGGLVFLNTWDGPIYIIALVAADGLRRTLRRGWLRFGDLWPLLSLLLALVLLTLFFYLPFLIGFRSQAAGILPNLITPTFLPHYFLMFGAFILLLAPFLWREARQTGPVMNWRLGFQLVAGLFGLLLAVTVALVLAALFSPELYSVALRFVHENGGVNAVGPALIARRLEALPTLLLLGAGLAVIAARVFARRPVDDRGEDVYPQAALSPATGYALLLVVLAIGLTLVPEFFYLRDNFATRINTIFKFYYQAWLMFSVASAFAVWTVLSERKGKSWAFQRLYAGMAIVVIGIGLLYPLLGIHNRMFVETRRAFETEPPSLSMDGGPEFINASDYAAIRCLEQVIRAEDEPVIVAEALGPAYNPGYGRVAALTGIPIVLGWENHERQWRGATYDAVAGSRPADIATLYGDPRWNIARDIIARQGIDYIFYGSSERATYSAAGEDKFRENLEPVCDFGGSVFYRVTPAALDTSRSG